jgi:cation transport ATPase
LIQFADNRFFNGRVSQDLLQRSAVAALTFLLTRNPLSTAAVLVEACSCSFALATPVAMLASIGASAKLFSTICAR